MMIDTERGELVKTPNDIEINGKITKKELIQTAVNTKNNKAYGHDEIPYEFYKNAPQKYLDIILKQMNNYWTCGEYPQDLKDIIINPILKPGKIPPEAKSYRFTS